MSEQDGYEELYEEEPASAEEQLTEAYYADPVGTINLVANAAAEQRALDAVAAIGGQLHGVESRYAGGVAAQSTTMALNRLGELYGAAFEEAKPAIGEYLAQRPYLQNADVTNPHVAFDILNSAFENVKGEVRREKDRNSWQAIKDAGSNDYGSGFSG